MQRYQGAKVEHLRVSNVIYHKFSHGAVSYMLNGENVNVMLEFIIKDSFADLFAKSVATHQTTPYEYKSWLGSKLSMLIVNVSLKFQMFISQIRQYFLLKKCEKLWHCKSFSHFSTKISVCLVIKL